MRHSYKLLTILVLMTVHADAAIYTWIANGNNNLNVEANWSLSGLGAGTDPATPSASADQIHTNSADDEVVFNSSLYVTTPRNIYTRTGNRWGVIRVLNGTINWQNDSNSQGNYGYSDAASGTPTVVVGDGDGTAAVANMNLQNWNHGGGAGTKTYVINSDGTLASARNADYNWSNGTGQDTVMRLIGGTVNFTGRIKENTILSDSGDYVVFEDFGSTFTFAQGASDGLFNDSTDVTDAFGDSFRLGGSLNSGNAALQLTDGGTTWTIDVIAIPEAEAVILCLLSSCLLLRRRRY